MDKERDQDQGVPDALVYMGSMGFHGDSHRVDAARPAFGEVRFDI